MARIPGPRSPFTIASLVRAVNADPYRTLSHVQSTYGPVSKIDLGPVGMAVMLFGPEANEFILSTKADAFRWHGAMKTLVPVEGKTSLIVSDGPDHARRRKVVQPAFHKRAVDGHLALMVDEADRMIDGLRSGDEVDAHRQVATAIERMAIAALLGPRLRARANDICRGLAPAIAFVNEPPLRQYPLPWRGTRYHAARAGRATVAAIIDEEIARRRSALPTGAPSGRHDVLDMLMAAERQPEPAMRREEVRDQIISLIANYDTTSAAAGWAVHRLVTEPDVWDRTRDELDRVIGDRPLAVDDLAELGYLDGVVNETLRLHPPSIYSPREVAEEVHFDGYRIRKGAFVLFSPFITGRDPVHFPDPLCFRPERWDSSRPDHHAPHPYAFVPFGGRARRCIGFAFATLQLKAVIAQLVRRTELEPLRRRPPTPQGSVAVRPGDGVPVRVLAVHAPDRPARRRIPAVASGRPR